MTREIMKQQQIEWYQNAIAQARASLDSAEESLFRRDESDSDGCDVRMAIENAADTLAEAVSRHYYLVDEL